MKSLKQIKSTNKSGNYYAVSTFGALYEASYNAELGVMFFAIPASVEIVGYIEREG